MSADTPNVHPASGSPDALNHLGAETVVGADNHKMDNDRQVFFYEQDFYVLSNFSAFNLVWKGCVFQTSEAAYHWEKFREYQNTDGIEMAPDYDLCHAIRTAPSAHEAFKIAERAKEFRRPDWDSVKVDLMLDILRAKAAQHEYVRRKLLATGTRELIEDSWRDDFWGWGPNRDGKNMLGQLWMQVRSELTTAQSAQAAHLSGEQKPDEPETAAPIAQPVPQEAQPVPAVPPGSPSGLEDPLTEALLSLRDACNDSDDGCYGTLSTKFVREICNDALAASQPSTTKGNANG